MVRVHVIIKGFVQGIGFRYFLKQKADELGLAGWVRNLPAGRQGIQEGNVEAVFEGREDSVEKAIAVCKEGPPFANVEHVTVERSEANGNLQEFTIKYY